MHAHDLIHDAPSTPLPTPSLFHADHHLIHASHHPLVYLVIVSFNSFPIGLYYSVIINMLTFNLHWICEVGVIGFYFASSESFWIDDWDSQYFKLRGSVLHRNCSGWTVMSGVLRHSQVLLNRRGDH